MYTLNAVIKLPVDSNNHEEFMNDLNLTEADCSCFGVDIKFHTEKPISPDSNEFISVSLTIEEECFGVVGWIHGFLSSRILDLQKDYADLQHSLYVKHNDNDKNLGLFSRIEK